jgi:hypothetical protein
MHGRGADLLSPLRLLFRFLFIEFPGPAGVCRTGGVLRASSWAFSNFVLGGERTGVRPRDQLFLHPCCAMESYITITEMTTKCVCVLPFKKKCVFLREGALLVPLFNSNTHTYMQKKMIVAAAQYQVMLE